MSAYRLHYRGNIIGRAHYAARPGERLMGREPVWQDGYGLPLVVRAQFYDAETDRTTVELDVWNPDAVPADGAS